MVLKENNTNWDFRCGVWEMIWNTWLRLSSGMARWVEFETNFWQILWLMFQVAEAGVLAWGDLITLGRLDDLENQIIVSCLQEIGWCNSRGEISSTGMCILCKQKIFSMKYTVVFIYPCRPQTSPACWFTLPGPLASPRGWWCHRFLSNFHSETLKCFGGFFLCSSAGQYHLDCEGGTRDLWLELGLRRGGTIMF